jgi:phosphopantothenoylcysteine decarboxylase/phosphopantothenate--cysteine ligase
VVGFAAETNEVEAYATAKLARKGCDWIVANDVSIAGTMGGDDNAVAIVTSDGIQRWSRMAKTEVARKLAERMAQEFS